MNQEQLNTYLKVQKAIEDLAYEVLGDRDLDYRITELDVDKTTIEVWYEYYSAGSGSHYHHEQIPTDYLWDPDWLEKYKKEQERRNFEALRKREQEEKEEEQRREEQSYRQYLVLKEKYEGGSNENHV